MSLCINPQWDPGVVVVEPADRPRILSKEGIARIESQVAAIDAMISVYGEAATLEALRRRGVLVEDSRSQS